MSLVSWGPRPWGIDRAIRSRALPLTLCFCSDGVFVCRVCQNLPCLGSRLVYRTPCRRVFHQVSTHGGVCLTTMRTLKVVSFRAFTPDLFGSQAGGWLCLSHKPHHVAQKVCVQDTVSCGDVLVYSLNCVRVAEVFVAVWRSIDCLVHLYKDAGQRVDVRRGVARLALENFRCGVSARGFSRAFGHAVVKHARVYGDAEVGI